MINFIERITTEIQVYKYKVIHTHTLALVAEVGLLFPYSLFLLILSGFLFCFLCTHQKINLITFNYTRTSLTKTLNS